MTREEKIEQGKEIVNSEKYQKGLKRRKQEAASPEYEDWIYEYLEEKDKIDEDYAAAFLTGQEQYNCMLLPLYSLHKILDDGCEKHLINDNWDHYYINVTIKDQDYIIETSLGQGFGIWMTKKEKSLIWRKQNDKEN